MEFLQFYLPALGLSVAGFAILWPLSILKRDASIADFWWTPGIVAQMWLVSAMVSQTDSRVILLNVVILVWALRLGWVLIGRRIREGSEDSRYGILRDAWGEGFWWKSFFIVFLLQAVIQWVIALGPLSALVAEPAPLGALSLIGCVIVVGGLYLETRADAELDAFRRTEPPDALMETGLRAHVRHPNYVGEMLVWVGIGCIIAEVSLWGAILSPAIVILLLTTISGAPILDERLSQSRPGYRAYCERVPAFIPRLSKSGAQ
ncbi:DUF1295 domain-containing protein [Rhodobacteraceae bacterium NNCM2]|nr:DUF1295 domain-containing protein [Coraliihabitans acroporae]